MIMTVAVTCFQGYRLSFMRWISSFTVWWLLWMYTVVTIVNNNVCLESAKIVNHKCSQYTHACAYTHTHIHFSCSTLFKSFSLPGNAWYCHLPDKVHSFFITRYNVTLWSFPVFPREIINQSISSPLSFSLVLSQPWLPTRTVSTWRMFGWTVIIHRAYVALPHLS